MHGYLDGHSHILKCLKILKIHRRMYLGGVNEGILLDHFMSLKQGLKFLRSFLDASKNKDLLRRIKYLVSHAIQKLDSLRYIRNDESLVMKLEHAYADLREEMKNVIIKPGTNDYDIIFPETITYWYNYYEFSVFIHKRINKLLSSDCMADHITHVMKELEDIRNMLESLGPFFTYARFVEDSYRSYRPFTVKELEVFSTITSVLGRAKCFTYLSFVGKMDAEMVFSLKNGFSDLIIEDTQIMRMYLIIDIESIENLQSHISMSFRLLEWNKKSYLGTGMRAALEDHFMSIELGLQFLVQILKVSTNNDLKLRIQHLVAIIKPKLYSLSHYQEDENLIVKLEHEYGELREEMQNVIIKPGSDAYDLLFPEIFEESYYALYTTSSFLIEKISVLVTSSYKADQITRLMKELEELRMKLTLFHSFSIEKFRILYSSTEVEEIALAALTTFLDKATCLIYFSFIGNLNEDMLVSLGKHFSLLFEECETKEMSLGLGIILYDELESDIDISLSLLKRQEEYQISTTNGAMLEDHILSLKNGIELLKLTTRIFIDSDVQRRIILLAGNVKKKLERLTYIQDNESINMDVNGAYADLREDMKNLFINPSTNNILFPQFKTDTVCLRENNDFLREKITTLATSNCKANQIAPMKKELHNLRKMITFLKPLLGYEVTNFSGLFTIHQKATLLIYLSFVGKMDREMMLSVKSNIAGAVQQIDILKIYTVILNKKLNFGRDYLEKEIYLLENLILLLKSNFESLSDANSKLYQALIDIHIFLLGLPRNVLFKKLHLLEASSQDLLSHSIAIISSCYLEHTEVYISNELNCVIDLINRFKSEAQEIKLYYFPRVDDMGFLEFFLGYLKDLLENQEISMKEEIHALHFEVQQLLSLAKVRNQELNEKPWTDTIDMVYQAEYIIDLHLVNSSKDLVLISYLSKIIDQLKNGREDMNNVVNWNLSHLCESIPAEDFAGTFKSQVGNYEGIIGMHEEANRIMEHLLKGENKLDVISIVGMAGVGKTTLALTLYNTPSMADRFDILAWCTVSQSYQNRELLLTILNEVNPSDKNPRSTLDDGELDQQELADRLCRSLKKRRYLIVFDDIWDSTLWNDLKSYLPDDRNGSRILITTRNKDVANQIRSKVHELHGLSKAKSWELFLKKMAVKESLSVDLLECSKQIVEHCKGLPLSIVIIAGILSGIERTKKKWKEIAESVNSLVLSNSQGQCRAILELSYKHLPNHLRSCFLYVASYPEDQEISVNHLVMRWIAEGLILGTKSDSPEEVAIKYMEDLIVKSLVIPAKERSQGGVKTFRLHDLLRDFCMDKAKEKHFFNMVLDRRNVLRPVQDPRRVIMNLLDVNKKLKHFSCHSIRSFIWRGDSSASAIEKRIGSYDMVLLKVLEVDRVGDIFPDVLSLVHLRFLSLISWHSIIVLPDLMSKLRNLQFLILKFDNVTKVPDSIWDMVQLRHVHITKGASFVVDSNKLENSSFLLKNLRYFSTAWISLGDFWWVGKLLGLQRLTCHVVDDDDDDLEDNQIRMLGFNSQLISLKMQSERSLRKSRISSTCQWPTSLRKLTLSGFYLNDISKIGSTLPYLEVFKIDCCGLPFRYKWYVDDEDFPNLKVLKLTNLDISKLIVSEDSFPNLEQLWVERSRHLGKIPLEFGHLLKLRLISLKDCNPSVIHSAREIEKIQHEDQNTEMRVHLHSTRR